MKKNAPLYIFLKIATIALLMNNSKIINAQTTRIYSLIGHRGAASEAPENTLASIEKALTYGVDRVEVDVQMTKDGQIILMHDRTLNRTTSGKGAVKNLTLAEIKELDAGAWFGQTFVGEKVPTLEEVINLIDARCELLIEVKNHSGYSQGIEETVASIIRRQKAEKWCFAISFRHKVIRNFHEIAPDIRLQKSYVGKLSFLPIYISNGITFRGLKKYSYVEEFNINKDLISSYILKKSKKMCKKVNVWTDDNPKHAQKLIQRGVYGIITNCPGDYYNKNLN